MNESSKNPEEKKDTYANEESHVPAEPLAKDAFRLQSTPWKLRIRRGVYRFKTHEEANAHMDKILGDSGWPKI